jgi:hypothetical protein
MEINKRQSHGKIGEAAVAAKCWMHGIPAYNTAGLRANFAGSDLLLDTKDPTRKLLVQVKTGYSANGTVYLTQCAGEHELEGDKFVSDFVVFVNIDRKAAEKHTHRGELDFAHLTFYVVPRERANFMYRTVLVAEHARPKRDGGQRKLGNMAVYVPIDDAAAYKDAWYLIREHVHGAA